MCVELRGFSLVYKCVFLGGDWSVCVSVCVCAAADARAGAEEEQKWETTEDGRRAVDVQCSHP